MLLSRHCLLTLHFVSMQKPLATAGKKMRGLQEPLAWCSVAVSRGLAGDASCTVLILFIKDNMEYVLLLIKQK